MDQNKSKSSLLKSIAIVVGLVGCLALGIFIGRRIEHSKHFVEGHPVVDLGLSVRWAAFNLGAEDVNDHGILANYFDAEKQSWGGKWRMPTSEEWAELLSECTREFYSEGLLLIGPNGNKLFLPRSSDSTFAYWSSTSSFPLDSLEDGAEALMYCPLVDGEKLVSNALIATSATRVTTRLVCE